MKNKLRSVVNDGKAVGTTIVTDVDVEGDHWLLELTLAYGVVDISQRSLISRP